MTRRWGVPEGVGRLSPAEVRGRNRTFRFQRRADRVEKVELIDGAGRPVPVGGLTTAIDKVGPDEPHQRECCYEYRYDQDGRVAEETARNRTGRVVWSLLYTRHQGSSSTAQPPSCSCSRSSE